MKDNDKREIARLVRDGVSEVDATEYIKILSEVNRKQNFIDRVDDREEDPDYSPEEMKAESEKYDRYEKEISELKDKEEKLREKFPKWEIVV
jgi:hypothetical protein